MTVALVVLAVAAVLAGRLHVLLHVLQQEHYETARLYVWVRRNVGRRLATPAAAAVLCGGVLADLLGVVVAAAGLAAAVAYAVLTWRREQV